MDAAVTTKRADARPTTGKSSAAKKDTRKKADTNKPAGKKPATKKSASKKSASKKPASKKPASKQAAQKTATKRATTEKATTEKATTKKATTKKATTKKAASKAAASKNTAPKQTTTPTTTKQRATTNKATTKKATTKKTTGKKATGKKTTPSASSASARPSTVSLAVLPGEDPWTTAEVDDVRGELEAERQRLLSEISSAEDDMATLLRDAGVGAGSDQADIGSSALERDSEMSLANNTRDMLFQVDRAKTRLDDGSYGICESCGNPIGKARLLAFPRATLCMPCKQRQERR